MALMIVRGQAIRFVILWDCAALEAIPLEAYRQGKLSTDQVRRLLGYQTRMGVDGFLRIMASSLDTLSNI